MLPYLYESTFSEHVVSGWLKSTEADQGTDLNHSSLSLRKAAWSSQLSYIRRPFSVSSKR